MVKEGLSKEVRSEVRPQWKEGLSHTEIISEGTTDAKAKVCLGCWRCKEVSVSGGQEEE